MAYKSWWTGVIDTETVNNHILIISHRSFVHHVICKITMSMYSVMLKCIFFFSLSWTLYHLFDYIHTFALQLMDKFTDDPIIISISLSPNCCLSVWDNLQNPLSYFSCIAVCEVLLKCIFTKNIVYKFAHIIRILSQNPNVTWDLLIQIQNVIDLEKYQ